MQNNTDQSSKTVKLSQRMPNESYRTREFLTTKEVDKLGEAAKNTGRHGLRDETLIVMMFRHALRVGEVVALKWEQVDLDRGLLHVRRLKRGLPGTHPLRGAQIRSLRKLKREMKDGAMKYADSPYVFVNELGSPLSTNSVHKIVKRAGELASMPFSVHPHMLRHSTGFYLANDKRQDTRAIQGYMGHANINNTTIYTQLAANRYNNFWDD